MSHLYPADDELCARPAPIAQLGENYMTFVIYFEGAHSGKFLIHAQFLVVYSFLYLISDWVLEVDYPYVDSTVWYRGLIQEH